MGIASSSGGSSARDKINVPKPEEINVSGVRTESPIVVPNPERTALVDSRYLPVDKLVAHVEGSDWKVNFYQQLLAQADEPKALDLDLEPTHQQYRLVKDFILKVTDPLEYSQDPETHVSSYVGSGTMMYNLTPNINDMFVAKISDGLWGVFTITTKPQRLSITKNSAWEIEYQMVNYFDETYEISFEEKTIDTVVFTPEIQELVESPFLTEEAYNRYLTLDEYRYQMEYRLATYYYSNAVGGLPIPEQDFRTADPYLCRFANTLGYAREHNKPIKIFHCGAIDYEHVYTIWDWLTRRDRNGLKQCIQKFWVTPVQSFSGTPNAISIAYSGYERTLVPSLDEFKHYDGILLNYPLSTRPPVELPDTLPEALSDDFNKTRPIYHSTTADDFYVLSRAFYEDDKDEMSVLELLLKQMLNDDPVEPNIVVHLCDTWSDLPEMEQYYYGPLILSLVHYVEGR